MDLKSIINSPGMWVASSFMVVVVIGQAILFLWAAFSEAKRINIPRERCIQGLRSALITALGPSLGPIIILVSLIAVLGAPTTWMRLNDIGAARTELAISTLAVKVSGMDLRSPALDLKGFSYALWGQALNNFGFIAVALLLTHRMGGLVKRMSEKTDATWIKYLVAGAATGLFAYLLTSNTIATKTIRPGNIYAALISGATFLLISKMVYKVRVLQEPALGIAMFVGMLAAAALE
jgi:hypothetical protein